MRWVLAFICMVNASTAVGQESPQITLADPDTPTWVYSLKQQISACYLPPRNDESGRVRILNVAFELGTDTRPIADSIRYIEQTRAPGKEAAFEAARRAIVRCGSQGFDLPLDLYSQWQFMQMAFVYGHLSDAPRPRPRPIQ